MTRTTRTMKITIFSIVHISIFASEKVRTIRHVLNHSLLFIIIISSTQFKYWRCSAPMSMLLLHTSGSRQASRAHIKRRNSKVLDASLLSKLGHMNAFLLFYFFNLHLFCSCGIHCTYLYFVRLHVNGLYIFPLIFFFFFN